MSATKIRQPIYKVFEPDYYPQRTIIVDDELGSPETLTIRLEEAARNGGDLGPCPPGLLPMSAYKTQPPQLHGYADTTYSQYSAQPFPTQETECSASHLNQIAFAANNATSSHYLETQGAPGDNIDVLSCQPTTGSPGTRVSLKVISHYDLLGHAMTTAAPFVSILFGSRKCTGQVARDLQHGEGGGTYTITAEAPHFPDDRPSLGNVPLTLLVKSAGGEEVARVSVGVFTYCDVRSVTGRGDVEDGAPGDSRQPGPGSPKTGSAVPLGSPPHQDLQARTKPVSPVVDHALPESSTTNAYNFPPSVSAVGAAQMHAQAPVHHDYTVAATGAYGQGAGNIMPGYRGPSFADHWDRYPRPPPMLRSPQGAPWMFGDPIEPIRASSTALSHTTHASVARSSSTPLQHLNAVMPQLVRTSTLTQPASNGFPGYGVYQEKVTLKLMGNLTSMAEGWTQEEWESKRRLVLFRKQQHGSVLTVTFKAVSPAERPPHSICISCIWWEEKHACYVTSVDTIHLLEQLLAAPNRFGVEEKNRIRRNLEGFQPTTVSKAKAESEEFFKVIMGFGNPKPRNIEKDVKVFQWKDLAPALFKIISKYSASTASVVTPTSSPQVVTTAGLTGGYAALPPTPVSTPSAVVTDTLAAASYVSAGHHYADPLTSPRGRVTRSSSLSTYRAARKGMSPALKNNSPVATTAVRIPTLNLPVIYEPRSTIHSLTSPYGLSGPSHHSQHHGHGSYSHQAIPVSQSQTRSWETYPADSYSTQAGSAHSQGYGGAAYGDGSQRA